MPGGAPKTGDSACFGIFRQNWGLLRQCCSAFKGQLTSGWQKAGKSIIANLKQDVQCLNECQKAFGLDKWIAGHDDGAKGLADPEKDQVSKMRLLSCLVALILSVGSLGYKKAIMAIWSVLKTTPKHLTDDVRVYQSVTAI
ncbi:hypothetical protein MMC13_003377 [Lambiella insularis]|nr:hypothetical protein [Lambiella insularis]